MCAQTDGWTEGPIQISERDIIFEPHGSDSDVHGVNEEIFDLDQ